MISFFKRLFGRNKQKRAEESGQMNATIQFKDSPKVAGDSIKYPDEDVHKLMIKATSIRKKEGYPKAIAFLQEIAEAYVREGNTALVTCMNKLIPYMKRDESSSYKETYRYLEQIIARKPENDPYFLALHITMAELIKSQNIDNAIDYLEKFLSGTKIAYDHYDILIKLIDLYIEKKDTREPRELLPKAKALLNNKMERYEYIKKERMWFRSSANFHLLSPGNNGKIEYLYHRFVEFTLDMARALNPIQVDLFHQRKDLYYKKERGFEDSEPFNHALEELGLSDEKDTIIKRLYGYAFEELPLVLNVTEKQLNFKPGQEETIEELREKKVYCRRPFTELPAIEDHIRKFVKRFVDKASVE
jgi:hypothetical protein